MHFARAGLGFSLHAGHVGVAVFRNPIDLGFGIFDQHTAYLFQLLHRAQLG